MLEKEILSSTSRGNIHLAEERGQRTQEDNEEGKRDEEMKYSGVYRSVGDLT